MHKQDRNLSGQNKPTGSRFLFDLNNFDDPGQEEPEEELAPSFSEEELEAAKAQAFQEGKQAGIEQEKGSRDQKVANTLGQILQTFQTLIIAEGQREQVYEEESLRLLHSALKNLFPVLNQRLGTKELEDMIERVVTGQSGKSRIIIRVPKGMEEDIQTLLASKMPEEDALSKIQISSDESLQEGSATLQWEDGGAVRNAQKLIENMILEVDRLLPAPSSDETVSEKDDINDSDAVQTVSEEPQPTGEVE